MKYLCLLFLVGCVNLAHVDPQLRTVPQQRMAAVYVESYCDGVIHSGSGVVVSERHVITAAHVVRCAGIPHIHVTFYNGKELWMVVERDNKMYPTGEETADSARLVVMGLEHFELYIAPPELGDGFESDAGWWWCSWDFYTKHCAPGINIHHMMKREAHQGESGSGVYDEQGRLLGIAVQTDGTYTLIEPSRTSWLEGT